MSAVGTDGFRGHGREDGHYAPGDRDKARTLLGEAIEMYEQIGMPKHLEMAEGLLRPM